jgi:hypothetical protein
MRRTRSRVIAVAPGSRPTPLSALAVTLCAALAAAQVYERPLNEQDLQRLVPVLEADAVVAAQRARETTESTAAERVRAEARERAVGEVSSGADPLEWLSTHSRLAASPSTAVYAPGCSRAVTSAWRVPTAVLSFGVPAPSGWLALWQQRDPGAVTAPPPRSDRAREAARPAASAESVAQRARRFYSDRQFEYEEERAPFEWRFLAPDHLVSATVMGVAALGQVEACRTLATGPAVVLRAEGEMFGKGAPPASKQAGRALAAAREKAGLSEAEYLNLKLQLLNARADASAPPPTKVPQAGAIGDERQKELAIRRENVEFYRRHAALLDRLLAPLSVQ